MRVALYGTWRPDCSLGSLRAEGEKDGANTLNPSLGDYLSVQPKILSIRSVGG